MRTVDIHAHHVPRAFVDALGSDGARFGVEVRREDGGWRVAVGGSRLRRPLRDDVVDLHRRLEAMDSCGVDVQVLSCWAGLGGYDVEPAAAGDYARRFNEALAEAAAGEQARFRALAIAPLQDPPAAAGELEHAVSSLGMAGAEILTRVGGRELDDPALDRLDRGWHATPGVVATHTTRAPSAWLREVSYDTVAHSPDALRWLAEFAGPEHMLLGSDFPFPMGDPDPVGSVAAIAGFTDADRDAVLGANAMRLMELEAARG